MKVTREMLAAQAKRAKAEMQRARDGKHSFKVNGPAGAITVKVTVKPAPRPKLTRQQARDLRAQYRQAYPGMIL
jgi:DNA-binding protein YbaB